MSALRRIAACLLGLALLALPARPTWSIVVVDTRTGEVGVGTATCIKGFDINWLVPVIVPGEGCAAVQAAGDLTGEVRLRIWRGLEAGLTPREILALCKSVSGHSSRQYGIVDLVEQPVTFTGSGAMEAAGGVVGIVGDLRYAIQGNVLTGPEVWLAAEQALLDTPGDLSLKLMAAMEAARFWGGDGRCSCSPSDPTSCGAPPPSFSKSAHSAYVGIARIGDSRGVCNGNLGCANGDYFLSLNVKGGALKQDPVLILHRMYARWRESKQGRPDQVLSDVVAGADSLVADGHSSTSVEVRLADIEGVQLAGGGFLVEVQHLSAGDPVTVPGAVVDHGDGTYSFELSAKDTTGEDTWRVLATDGFGTVVLQPDVTIRVDPLAPLHVGRDEVSASEGGEVPFTLNLGPAQAFQPYVLLGSASGTQPGTPYGGLVMPLNRDRLFNLTLVGSKPPVFVAFQGLLDANGRAQASFAPPPAFLQPFATQHTDWAAAVLGVAPTVAGPVGMDVAP